MEVDCGCIRCYHWKEAWGRVHRNSWCFFGGQLLLYLKLFLNQRSSPEVPQVLWATKAWRLAPTSQGMFPCGSCLSSFPLGCWLRSTSLTGHETVAHTHCAFGHWFFGSQESFKTQIMVSTAFKLPKNTILILFISALTQGVVQHLLWAAYMLPRPLLQLITHISLPSSWALHASLLILTHLSQIMSHMSQMFQQHRKLPSKKLVRDSDPRRFLGCGAFWKIIII